jgi:thioredoxin-related protein
MNRTAAAPWLLSLLLLLPVVAGAAPSWRTWDEGLKEAARLQRPVLVDVYADWCGWCKRMDRDVYARPDVQGYLAGRFVTVKLDAESGDRVHWEGREMTSRALALRLGVNSYPTTVFLDATGRRLRNASGYFPAERFLQILRSVADGQAGPAGAGR